VVLPKTEQSEVLTKLRDMWTWWPEFEVSLDFGVWMIVIMLKGHALSIAPPNRPTSK
jgi:hypothetical protein